MPWKTEQFFRMWPRALFHMKEGKEVLKALNKPGVYVLYRDDEPYYIGKSLLPGQRQQRSVNADGVGIRRDSLTGFALGRSKLPLADCLDSGPIKLRHDSLQQLSIPHSSRRIY